MTFVSASAIKSRLRASSFQGASGWTICSTDPVKQGDYVAVRMADLLGACPLLREVLTLPVGYLVLLDEPEQTQALANAQGKLLWSTKLEGSAK